MSTLEERITARLHESIGDLVTEADLKDMVARGIERALFEPRVIKTEGTWSPRHETKPCIVDELVAQLLEKKMAKAVDTWLSENPEKLQAILDAVVRDGVANAVLRALDARFQYIFSSGIQELKNQGLLPRTTG